VLVETTACQIWRVFIETRCSIETLPSSGRTVQRTITVNACVCARAADDDICNYPRTLITHRPGPADKRALRLVSRPAPGTSWPSKMTPIRCALIARPVTTRRHGRVNRMQNLGVPIVGIRPVSPACAVGCQEWCRTSPIYFFSIFCHSFIHSFIL